MPYARRGYRKRSYRKRPYARSRRMPWYNKKYSVGEIASSAWKGVRYLKTLVNSEMYKKDNASSITPDSASGSVVHLSDIAQGDGDDQRSGLSVFARSLWLQIISTIHTTADNTNYRVMVVCDTQQVGDGTPTVATILDGVGINTPLNSATVGRFSVLYDKVYNLADAIMVTRIHRIYLPLSKHIRYNGSAGTDIQKNGIYLVAVSSEATNTPTLNYNSRLSYRDN